MNGKAELHTNAQPPRPAIEGAVTSIADQGGSLLSRPPCVPAAGSSSPDSHETAGVTTLSPAVSHHRVADIHYGVANGPSSVTCTCGATLHTKTAEALYAAYMRHSGHRSAGNIAPPSPPVAAKPPKPMCRVPGCYAREKDCRRHRRYADA